MKSPGAVSFQEESSFIEIMVAGSTTASIIHEKDAWNKNYPENVI